VKPGGFGVVPLGFATDAPRGSAGSFTICLFRFSADVYADLSTDIAEKTYQVKFADWVGVYLHVAMETSSEDYAV
jgi:hypothetical protein